MPRSNLTRRSLMAAASALSAFGRTPAVRRPDGFVDIVRPPDLVIAFLQSGRVPLARNGPRWSASGIAVDAEPRGTNLPVSIEAPNAPLERLQLRWRARVPERWRILNDQWERSYGDLEWRGISGDRVLPWYFLAFDGQATHGYGVATGAASFAFWQADPDGISLWLDLRNGGEPAQLGQRILEAATIVARRGGARPESAFAAARTFLKQLSPHPRLASLPVYGGNNWYYAYGQNCSAGDIERDAALMAELAPAGANRPFMVIDDGWSVTNTAGPWERGNSRFPDMPGLATAIKRHGAKPGIWMRPLATTSDVPESARLRAKHTGTDIILDPTIPENLETVRRDVARMAAWGYELVKHDYSSFDLLGRWGPAMGAELTDGGWHFADRTRTTAEIVLALYRTIREAAGNSLVIGCNTFGHLAAGLVELQRTGDDTSGREFHRTRRMGVNTLAFRGPQHGVFFDLDADCAPITPALPWNLASAWLDLLARSGTALFVSPDPRSINRETKDAIRRAFAMASVRQPAAEPLDWMETTTPSRWRAQGREFDYDWYGPEGGTPFPR